MNSSTNAASSSSSSTPIYFSTAGPYTGKGKQRAELHYQELILADDDLSDADWEIVNSNHKILSDSFMPRNSLFRRCVNVIHTADERWIKMADRKGELQKLERICQAQHHTIGSLKNGVSIDRVTHIGLEKGKVAHIDLAQQQITRALHFVQALCEKIQTLLSDSQRPIDELNPCIEEITTEIGALQKSLPSPAKAFLWVILFAVVFVPVATLAWYSLTSLGVISMTAALAQALTGIAWVACVLAGILKSWPEYKNACAERASSCTRTLIQCHETIRSAYKDFKKKMEYAQITRAAENSKNAALASAASVQLGLQANEKLDRIDRLLASRSESASPDSDLKAENARLREQLAKSEAEKEKLRDYNMQLMAAAMNNVNKNV